MGTKLKGLLSAVVAVAATTLVGAEAQAQQTVYVEPDTILEIFDRVSYQHSGNYYRNRSLGGQLRNIFGAPYPELAMDRDAEATEEALKELMFLQNNSSAIVRVPDLRSPYNTSIQLLPLSQVTGSRVVNVELNFEPLPRR
jgi:hypothetical protein